jgi:2-methylcitrate dehydratase
MLKFIIPLYFFNYRDLGDKLIVTKDDVINIKEFDIDNNLKIKNFNLEEIEDFSFTLLSKNDIEELKNCRWAINYECAEKEFVLYYRKINILLLAFRILKHAGVGAKVALCETSRQDYENYWDNWLPALRLKIPSAVKDFSTQELNDIKNTYKTLIDFQNFSFRTKHAVNFLFLAYTSYYWMEVFILLMTSIETLVSPSDEKQITTRIMKRLRGLIKDSDICSKTKLEKLYNLRSNIIHGRVVENTDFEEHKSELNDLQMIVLTAFNKIISTDFSSIYSNEKSKEEYFMQFENNSRKEIMNKSISRTICEFSINLKYKDLPEEVIREVKRFLYDSIGCAFGGYHTKDVKIVRNIYKEIGGKKESTVIGFGDKLPAVNSTLINSLMIRALDFNDIYWKEDPSHPSDLIPAALSVGEMTGASMKDVITAIVLDYEFEQRLCEFAVPGIRERKWHHATLTQFVSPIIAGKLLKLNVDQMVNAIGINGSHNYTIGCPTAGKLAMMKNTVDPMAVQSGVFAALMAKKGYTGTEAVFEGKEGFMDCFFGWNVKDQKVEAAMMKGRESQSEWKWDVSKLIGGLGQSYKILECGMKAFPTEALTHTHISAALKVVTKNNITFDQIESVTITTIARACDILFDPHKYRPESRETADHSLPYCIAAALVDHKITTQSFSENKMKDPRIWEVIDKIRGEASQEFEKMFPAKQPSKVVIKTKDGKEFSEYLEYPKGDPREPMTDQDLDDKFGGLTEKLLIKGRRKEIKDAIFQAELLTAREFMKKLIA